MKLLLQGITTLALIFLVACLDPKQDHEVKPTELPHYSLYGRVINESDQSLVGGANVSTAMTRLVQGDWVAYREGLSDSAGYYTIDSLYRGQYQLEVSIDDELSFSRSIDMMLYEDRELDIVIPAPPEVDFEGRITRCGSNVFLSGAIVTLEPILIENGGIMETRSTQTNSVGVFRVSNIYEGRYTIDIRRSGYSSHSQIVTVDNPVQNVYELDFCLNQSISF